MTDDLMALADRVEALDGPCREADAEIGRYAPHLVAFLGGVPDAPQYGGKHYTASLDDAMTLVPDPVDWSLVTGGGEPSCATVRGTETRRACHGFAATPALALTAASLRARAAKEPEA